MTATGIVVAMLPEAKCLTGGRPQPGISMNPHPGVSLHVGGIGPERAARAAEQLVAGGARALLSLGVAGALTPHLAPGDLLIPETVETANGTLRIHSAWRKRVVERISAAGVIVTAGNLVETDEVVTTPARKAALAGARNAAAVDMESGAVLRVAARHGLPALVLRVIADAAHMEIPAFVIRRTDPFGNTDTAGLLLDLLRAPAQLPALLGLGRASFAALNSLRRLSRLLPEIIPDHDVLGLPR
ncbi:MAG: nucleosidase [Gammaproteobacteria bacterium]|nr:nucleosidase [Gammaproteobacteria bacterium]